jgi:hypothetical protein
MKIFGLIGVLVLTAACNNAAPTATGYKQQLGAPAAVTGDNSGNATGGDAAKGQAALAACTSCHVDGGIGHKLGPADADSIASGAAAGNPAHGAGLKATFDADGKNIAAYLKGGSTGGTAPAAGAGDAAKGEALLTGTCEAACHGKTAGPLDSFVSLDGQETAAYHPLDVQKAITDNKADLAAALKARP